MVSNTVISRVSVFTVSLLTIWSFFISTYINATESRTEIHFDEFSISPQHIPAGGKFQLTVRYTASDPGSPDKPIPIVFYYKLGQDGKALFTSEPITIQSPNNESTVAAEKRNIKVSKRKGVYRIDVYLLYGDKKGIMSKKDFVIE